MKSLRQQICEVLAGGDLTLKDLQNRLGVQSRAEAKKVTDALGELAREGKTASKPGAGGKLWRLAEPPVLVQAKLWEFMRLRYAKMQNWTTAEAAKRADCTRDYATRFTRYLADEQFVEPVGQKGNAVFYRIVAGQEKGLPPHWNRRAEQRRRAGSAPPPAALPSRADKLGQALEVLEVIGRGLVEVPEAIERAREIIRKMQGELLSLEGRGDGDPGEPADHHQS
jgi:hypothetical protein